MTAVDIPIQLTNTLELRGEPKSILAYGYNNKGVLELMVQWDLPSAEATWENASLLNQQFAQFHLEDKVKLLPSGIAIPFNAVKGWITYQRRQAAAPSQIGKQHLQQQPQNLL